MPLAPSPAARVSLISFLVLVLELALIREVPSEVRAIAYFTNLLLFASFFGLGLGCILRPSPKLDWLLPIGLLLIAGFIALARGIVVYEASKSVHFWIAHDRASDSPAVRIPLLLAALLAFVFAALPFITLGRALGAAMDALPRLRAYGWDLGGSLAGSVLFSLSAWAGLPPWAWIMAVAVTWAAVFVTRWPQRVVLLAAAVAFGWLSQGPHPARWSPYTFVQYESKPDQLTVWVNSSFHQSAVNFTDPSPRFQPISDKLRRKFSVPYEAYREKHDGKTPERVLILGAGTGNDVSIARLQGVKHITAIEIDPVILDLGRRFSPNRAYDAHNVTAIVDDARHFLSTTDQSFDLVLFGTLDSQSLLSGHANLRLENYVYTAECFAQVRDRLVPGGMMAAYYSVYQTWFQARIAATVRRAFGPSTELLRYEDAALFNTIVLGTSDERVPVGLAPDPEGELSSTDDWPFIYMEHPTIPGLYLGLFGALSLLIAGVYVHLRRRHRAAEAPPALFLLGVGFTLTEAAAVVRLALVFGTTWVVSAVVFSAVLLTVFLANLAVLRGWAPRPRIAWAGVIGSLLVNYMFPLEILLGLDPLARLAIATVLVGTPFFFAGLCFSRLFEGRPSAAYALGLNLIGAMAGGILEYASMLTGMRDVWLLATLVYLLALLSHSRAPQTVRPQ